PPASVVPPPVTIAKVIIPEFFIPKATTQLLPLDVGKPVYEMEEGSLSQIHPITSEPIHRTIPLLVARLTRLDGQIEEIHAHQREVSVARIELD
ncbi:hypothetical protein Tco_0463650, partial [Tanacetum coccineum]